MLCPWYRPALEPMSPVRQGILKPIRRPGLMAGLDGNVSDGMTLTKLDKSCRGWSQLDGSLTERSDSQFAGLVNSWTGRCVRRFVKSRNAFLKSHLYQLSVRANFSLHFSTLARELRNLLTVCRKRQQIRPIRAWTASLCSIYCCLVLFSFLFTI